MIWKINYVERGKSNGFIRQVIWECSSIQDGITGRIIDAMGFEGDEPKIPFDEVTESNIVDWVKETLGEKEVQRIEANVKQIIADNKNNERSVGAPWATLLAN